VKLGDKILFILLFGMILFVSVNRHSRHPKFDYHSQIFSDKAGYHVFLPATVYYAWNAELMPHNIDSLTGLGFRIEKNKIVTKYPLGVAILHAPFFAIAAGIDYGIGEQEYLGYTETQHLALNWSTAIYGTFALLLIFLMAVQQWSLNRRQAWLLVFLVAGCSNLFYYLTRDAGMAHAYLLFCYSLIVYLFYTFLASKSWITLASIIMLSLLALSARYINGVFLLVALLYFILKYKNELANVSKSTWQKGLVVGVILGIIPLILQLCYNLYAFESIGTSGYAAESFSNWNTIKLIELWFAPNNGVFIYAPVLVIALYGVWRNRGKDTTLWLFAVLFILISVVYGAWWSPTLGCGFGHRGYTEFFVFFSLPVALVIRSWSARQQNLAWILGLIVAVSLFSAQWTFDGCWHGDGPWDWVEFFRLFRV
jgi:hypothetical protein